MSIVKLAAATAVAALLAGGASAAVVGTIPGSGTNDALVPVFGSGTTTRTGYYGAQLYLTGTADLTVEFIGAEAGNKNTFHWADLLFATTSGSGGWSTAGAYSNTYSSVAAGLLDFAFGINSTTASLFNGTNPDGSGPSSPANFFVTFDDENASSGQIAYLFLDDGDVSDDNHDDMVIRLSVTGGDISIAPVPLPAAGFLLLGGLGAMGAIARRRKSA